MAHCRGNPRGCPIDRSANVDVSDRRNMGHCRGNPRGCPVDRSTNFDVSDRQKSYSVGATLAVALLIGAPMLMFPIDGIWGIVGATLAVALMIGAPILMFPIDKN